MSNQPKSNVIPILMMCVWLLVMVFSFWWFEYRYWQLFADAKVTFDGQVLTELIDEVRPDYAVGQQVTVMHFTDEECPCSAYSRSHIQNLQTVLAKSHQITVTPKDAAVAKLNIPATPSVAVWDKGGNLAYFGPYSSGALCGQGDDFVTRVMKELKQDKNPEWINMLGVGCYCPWQKQEESNA